MEMLLISIRSVFAHKMRSILTMLGVIIGIAAIISIFSIIEGNTANMKQQLLGGTNNTMEVLYDQISRFDKGKASNSQAKKPLYIPEISKESIKELKAINHIKSIGVGYAVNKATFYKNKTIYGKFSAATSSYISMKNLKLLEGHMISDEDQKQRKQVIIINEEMKKQLPEEVQIGSYIEINGVPFQLIGIYKEKMNDQVYNSEKTAFVPYDQWNNIFETIDNQPTVLVQTQNINDLQLVATKVAQTLNKDFPKSDYVFGIENFDKYTQQMEEFNKSNFYLLAGIASISLLVGGIGVMNIMLVSVTERTREIGVKKALGARRALILQQFLVESVLLTLIGGVIGIITGIIAGWVIIMILGYPYIVSVLAILGSLAFCCLIGIIFGLLPAIKASKLNPIEALRFE
ncbi:MULTISPECIES: ABC transporter permease [unclassified Enterococcus]|uniref:ABC transporter permease n=1 Tax=unclassified Enterococcus TaxID=2608891 RepID=UPI001555E3BD|nr:MULTISPECIES: ABC transporter permease [unclassified Enterococcus]MBS7577588.1 ABC transporter permease [Enterococcus sp. MMGLQ5-2]MBS7584913.1 ABC transporter permease [Enterococcus sp. MMGLQ5-1]NPD12768.1 FtsX-like permease family protein [Enterococcus sp. MMGLQ5-1]NPD37421.1 FtsX-like permease family protein [Enterococcus sp. MMGLQ5-2]